MPCLAHHGGSGPADRRWLGRKAGPLPLDRLEDALMESTAFTIEEATFDASLLPEGSRNPGTVAFHRAVTDYFEKSYASMGGQLSVVFAAGRIEVAWEPAAPEPAGPESAGPESAGPGAPAMASIGPLLQQRRFVRPGRCWKPCCSCSPNTLRPSTTLASSPAKRAGWRMPGCYCAGR